MELDKCDKDFLEDYRAKRIKDWKGPYLVNTWMAVAWIYWYENASHEDMICGRNAPGGGRPDSYYAFSHFREQRGK